MTRPRINFNHNWNNKLLNLAFSTIRLQNDHKYKVGYEYEIWYNDMELLGVGTIVDIFHFKLAALSERVAYLDTGYNKAAATQLLRTMYKNKVANPDKADFSLITILMPETKAHYIIPKKEKLSNPNANLFPETTLFNHIPQADILKL